MLERLNRGMKGKNFGDTFRLYLFDISFLAALTLPIFIEFGGAGVFAATPVALAALIVSQRLAAVLVPSQGIEWEGKALVAFYLRYVPDQVGMLLQRGSVFGISCDLSLLRGGARHEFALLLAHHDSELEPVRLSKTFRRLIAGSSSRAMHYALLLGALFTVIAIASAFLLVGLDLVMIGDGGFNLLIASLTFTSYVALHLMLSTVLIYWGRRRITQGEYHLRYHGLQHSERAA